MYSLLLDTHGNAVTLILYKDGKVYSEKNVITNNRHSIATFPLIEEVFSENKLDVHDLNEILVVNGPGSFTGVRIAVTIAKTLAYTLNIPIKSIDSLTILALNIVCDGEKYVSIPDKNGAFVGFFSIDNNVINMSYYNKTDYDELVSKNHIYVESDVHIDYNLIYTYLSKMDSINPHLVNPLYVKGLNIGNDK